MTDINIFSRESDQLVQKHKDEFTLDPKTNEVFHTTCNWSRKVRFESNPFSLKYIVLRHLINEHGEPNMDQIKYIRLQVENCLIVEFVNGSRACSCGLIRGELPNLREETND